MRPGDAIVNTTSIQADQRPLPGSCSPARRPKGRSLISPPGLLSYWRRRGSASTLSRPDRSGPPSFPQPCRPRRPRTLAVTHHWVVPDSRPKSHRRSSSWPVIRPATSQSAVLPVTGGKPILLSRSAAMPGPRFRYFFELREFDRLGDIRVKTSLDRRVYPVVARNRLCIFVAASAASAAATTTWFRPLTMSPAA